MQLIYLHGLNSDHNSPKGHWLESWLAAHRPEVTVQRPDLNHPPRDVMALLSDLIAQDHQTGLVGSSLGGFFATACVAQHGCPAVLINPSVRPFDTMQRYFVNGQNGHTTEGGWSITGEHLDELRALYQSTPQHAARMLVLLKEGDEVLDYRVAEHYYSQDSAQSPLMTEAGGDHFMTDMVHKIPLIVNFLFGRPNAYPWSTAPLQPDGPRGGRVSG